MERISNTKRIIITLCTVAVIALTALVLWRLRPLSDKELAEATVEVFRDECYLLVADSDTVMAFSGEEGDTVLLDGTADIRKARRSKVNVPGLMVNSMPVIPSCHGRVMVMPADTSRLCSMPTSRLRSVLERETQYIDRLIRVTEEQKRDVDYYLRTHNVMDMGFDIVARTDKRLAHTADSLHRLSEKLKALKDSKALRLVFSPRYYALFPSEKSGKVERECRVEEVRGGAVLLKTIGSVPDGCSTLLSKYSGGEVQTWLNKGHKPKVVLPSDVRIDTLGTYKGSVDSVRAAHGYGILSQRDGGYYEGKWVHGKRDGWGLSLSPGKRMRIGEWRDDRYLGERITYTSERIYGIDISRFQHEKGRKRFKIDWDRLAITSLGHLSKKTIKGKADYPISFIYIKSTEGTSVRNRYYAADYREARKRGYKVGAYHFFSTRTGGAAQAKYFMRNSRYTRGDLPPVLDIEPTHSQIVKMGGTAKMLKEVRQWLHQVEKAWGVRPILYISQAFVRKYMSSAPDLIHDYNVWIARYGEYKPELNLVFWQLSPDGRVRGIRTEVDINVFNGFLEEWERFCEN